MGSKEHSSWLTRFTSGSSSATRVWDAARPARMLALVQTRNDTGELLWQPSAEQLRRSNLTRFMQRAREAGARADDYAALHAWSVHEPADFWAAIWDFMDVRATRRSTRVVDDPERLPGARWFEGAELSFAENLLRFRDDRPALVFHGEGRELVTWTYAELAAEVARLAAALRELGVVAGDRIAAVLPNLPEAVVGMLAATSLGAIWSSCSPDFGADGVVDRFGQIEPVVLIGVDGYRYAGRDHDRIPLLAELARRLPTVRRTIVVPYASATPQLASFPGAVSWRDFLGTDDCELRFEALPFDHPIYILYSSGTTGVPKCIVHGAGGTLLQHLKELVLHTDLCRDDRIFYFTTCGWMMWNWLVSSLAVGATLVLYDGSPFHPGNDALFELAARARVSIFGTSAKFLAAAESQAVKPRGRWDLSALRVLLSTGSPLPPEGFRYVYRDIKDDVRLSSISGGTDIVSCFFAGNPNLPVYAGELQCAGLGMRVAAFDSQGRAVIGEKGELVCTLAVPSMPIGFWNDPDGSRYRAAYFERFPGVWHHGDFVEITPRGTAIVYGRSDATLNPGGVRIGTAEIYRQVETLPEIIDSIVVAHEHVGDVRIVLFVQLHPGLVLDEELRARIRARIRAGATPRHVPASIFAVDGVPYTRSGKKVELAVREIIHGRPVVNRDALANAEVLDQYAALAAREIPSDRSGA